MKRKTKKKGADDAFFRWKAWRDSKYGEDLWEDVDPWTCFVAGYRAARAAKGATG